MPMNCNSNKRTNCARQTCMCGTSSLQFWKPSVSMFSVGFLCFSVSVSYPCPAELGLRDTKPGPCQGLYDARKVFYANNLTNNTFFISCFIARKKYIVDSDMVIYTSLLLSCIPVLCTRTNRIPSNKNNGTKRTQFNHWYNNFKKPNSMTLNLKQTAG